MKRSWQQGQFVEAEIVGEKMRLKMMPKRKWSDEETEKLIQNYPAMGHKVVELFPERTRMSVTRKAENLGLRKKTPWHFPEVEEHDPGLIRNSLKFDEPVALVLLGDIHISPYCNEVKYYEWIKWLSENETAKHRGKDHLIRVIGMGDYIENGLPGSPGLSVWQQKYEPKQQREIIERDFEKFKDKILGLHAGNHEYRTYKAVGMEPVRDICKYLNVPQYGYGTFTYLTIGRQKYIIYTWHGTSGAHFEYTKLNACIKMGMSVDADIIGMGHVHHRASAIRTIMTAEGARSKYFILSGHFLRWIGSYAQQKGLTLGKDGASVIFMNNDRWDIDVEA